MSGKSLMYNMNFKFCHGHLVLFVDHSIKLHYFKATAGRKRVGTAAVGNGGTGFCPLTRLSGHTVGKTTPQTGQ